MFVPEKFDYRLSKENVILAVNHNLFKCMYMHMNMDEHVCCTSCVKFNDIVHMCACVHVYMFLIITMHVAIIILLHYRTRSGLQI